MYPQHQALSVVLNPLLWHMVVGSRLFLGLQRAPHFFLLSEWKLSSVYSHSFR